MAKKKIAVLFHERDRRREHTYAVHSMAAAWRKEGFETEFIFGTGKYSPADIVLVHVNLSVVPDEYLEFSRRYPAVLNGRLKDIRKSTISGILLRPGDSYDGEVIVKSDLNHAGWPELRLGRPWFSPVRAGRILGRRLARFGYGKTPAARRLAGSMADYRVYESISMVPARCFISPEVVVEKFVPEREGGLYFIRYAYFLGSRMTCLRLCSENPIVNFDSASRMESVEPHPGLEALRKKLGFDYGKFDYVEHEGGIILLDANKTPGGRGSRNSSEKPGMERLGELSRYRAGGINECLVPNR